MKWRGSMKANLIGVTKLIAMKGLWAREMPYEIDHW